MHVPLPFLRCRNGARPAASRMSKIISIPFPRDDDGTARQGYGLGLALARDVANRYGGSVAVESSSPSGTTMLLSFPLA